MKAPLEPVSLSLCCPQPDTDYANIIHTVQDMKELLQSASIPVPLLSPARDGLCYSSSLAEEDERICGAYREQVH